MPDKTRTDPRMMSPSHPVGQVRRHLHINSVRFKVSHGGNRLGHTKAQALCSQNVMALYQQEAQINEFPRKKGMNWFWLDMCDTLSEA